MRRPAGVVTLMLLWALRARGTATNATNTSDIANTTNANNGTAPAPAQLPTCNNQGLWATLPVPTYVCNNNTVSANVYRETIASDYIVRARQQRRQAAAPSPSSFANSSATNSSLNETNATSPTPSSSSSGYVFSDCLIEYSKQISLCICRHDWTGPNCTQQRAVDCVLSGPPPIAEKFCATDDTVAAMNWDTSLGVAPCRFATHPNADPGTTPISLTTDVDCRHTTPSPRLCNATELNPEVGLPKDCLEDTMFEYFYDNGKKRDTEWLVLSHDPQARVRMVFYNFDSLSFLAQEVSTGRLTGAQLFAGRRLAMTLSRGMADLGGHGGGRSFASGRIYGEMQLVLDEVGATAAEGQNIGSRPFTINRMIPGRADVPEVVASAPVIYDIKTYLEPFEEPAEGASVLAIGIIFVVLLVVGILYAFKVYNLYAVFCPGCSSGAKLKKH